MLKAVIFDFDGIIVDTEPIHYKAFQEILRPIGLAFSWNEYLEKYIGFDDRDAFREAFAGAGKRLDGEVLSDLINRKAEVFQEIVQKGVKPYQGVIELVQSISGKLPVALCSGALQSDIEPILAQFDLQEAFDAIVTANDVEASKPDPGSYLLALQRLDKAFPAAAIQPAECIAIEDTPAGIKSAAGAGMNVLAVTNSYQAEYLEGALHVTDSLGKVTLEILRSLLV
ncbi:MAG TPA: HAD family phosphatase [Geobacteraceae bacterium]|nr:HAD family phosphatase [Geobacteraceae bacterium]